MRRNAAAVQLDRILAVRGRPAYRGRATLRGLQPADRKQLSIGAKYGLEPQAPGRSPPELPPMTRPNLRRIALWTLLGALLVPALASARESGEPQRFHVVYPGQRLTSIAKRYKVSVDAIRMANGLGKNARLKPGDKLTIPGLDDPDGRIGPDPRSF